jgi:hypothetical protein
MPARPSGNGDKIKRWDVKKGKQQEMHCFEKNFFTLPGNERGLLRRSASGLSHYTD